MTAMSAIKVSDIDHRKLSGLLVNLSERRREDLEGLENELFRAEIVPAQAMPRDIVTMGSTVVYEDIETGRRSTVQISYPDAADIERGRISIFAPIGAALIGLKVGQKISWPLPNGRVGRIKVKQVIQDPMTYEESPRAIAPAS